jgi:hypothetical protein
MLPFYYMKGYSIEELEDMLGKRNNAKTNLRDYKTR